MLLSPNSDIAAGGWVPSTGSTQYQCLDEASLDRGDYVSLTAFATNNPGRVGFPNTTGTATAVSITVDYEINDWQSGGDPSVVIIKVYEASNLVATRTLNPGDSDPHTSVITLDSSELTLWNNGNVHSVSYERGGTVLFTTEHRVTYIKGDATIPTTGGAASLPILGA